jgi:RNA polymerase sigma-70 factor (ECF subfamily)
MDEARAKLNWFKSVVLPHQSALRARLRRIAPQRDDLDDMVADVLTRAYANPGWRSVDHGRAYVFTIARNLVIDQARRDKVVSFVQVVELDLLCSGQDLESQLCARDALRRLQALVDTLPQQCRRAFLLRRVHEKSMVEIADEMGLSVSTVEKHLGRAIRLVMQALAEQEELAGAGSGRSNAGDRGAGRPATDRAHR